MDSTGCRNCIIIVFATIFRILDPMSCMSCRVFCLNNKSSLGDWMQRSTRCAIVDCFQCCYGCYCHHRRCLFNVDVGCWFLPEYNIVSILPIKISWMRCYRWWSPIKSSKSKMKIICFFSTFHRRIGFGHQLSQAEMVIVGPTLLLLLDPLMQKSIVQATILLRYIPIFL